jgi:hypothetical protein
MFSEIHFCFSGYVNKQNCHYWEQANPCETHQVLLHSTKVTVSHSVSSFSVIRPYFYENKWNVNVTVASDWYGSVVGNFPTPVLWCLDIQKDWNQQAGGTSHTEFLGKCRETCFPDTMYLDTETIIGLHRFQIWQLLTSFCGGYVEWSLLDSSCHQPGFESDNLETDSHSSTMDAADSTVYMVFQVSWETM